MVQVPTSRLRRGTRLGAVAAKQVLRSQRTRVAMIGRSQQVRDKLAQASTVATAESVVAVLGSMKGVAMKLGQMLAILDLDLVPDGQRAVFQEKLAVLLDNAPTTPFPVMKEVIEADLGRSLEEVFAEFGTTPVGAASIGQVYRARLHDGRDVAVKVQYPGIETAVRSDLKNLQLLSRLWQAVLPWVTPALIDELAENLERELDYPNEAQTQARIADQFAGHPCLLVPRAYPELSGKRVLVTDFVAGRPFSAIRTLEQDERDRIGEIVYRFYVGSMFLENEFCGDPHPGNILLTPDGKVAFLDFGLFKQMNPEHVDFEMQCLRAAAEDRGHELFRLWNKRGIIRRDARVSPEDCIDYVFGASGWCLTDEVLTITPELASGAFLLAVDPREGEFEGMRSQNFPPEHLFSRRADFLTFGVLGQLNATANWHLIAREWLYNEAPVTPVGAEIAAWRAAN